MEMKYIVGLIIALIVLGIIMVFIFHSFGLFDKIIEWFKEIIGIV